MIKRRQEEYLVDGSDYFWRDGGVSGRMQGVPQQRSHGHTRLGGGTKSSTQKRSRTECTHEGSKREKTKDDYERLSQKPPDKMSDTGEKR